MPAKSARDCHRAQDLFDCLNRGTEFFVFGVKVRREAHTCIRAVVHQDVAPEQLGADLSGIWHLNAHGPTAAFRISRRIHLPPPLVRQANQLRNLMLRLLADVRNSSFADDPESWTRGI